MNSRLSKTQAAGLGTFAVIAALGVAGAAVGSSDDDTTEKPITGTALKKAAEAALAETGGGKVTDTEVDDEESKYEIEVTLEDGSEVDVQLDQNFEVIGSETDSDTDEDE